MVVKKLLSFSFFAEKDVKNKFSFLRYFSSEARDFHRSLEAKERLRMQKGEMQKLETQALELVNETDVPVTVDYIARKLSIAWDIARALLLGLACQGKIQATKTMKRRIFKPLDTKET